MSLSQDAQPSLQQHHIDTSTQALQVPGFEDQNQVLTRPQFANLLQRAYEGYDDKINIVRWEDDYQAHGMLETLGRFAVWIRLNCASTNSPLKHELYSKWFAISQEAYNGALRGTSASALRVLLYQSLLDQKALRKEDRVIQEQSAAGNLDGIISAVVDQQDATSHVPPVSTLQGAPEAALRKALFSVSDWIVRQCNTPPDSEVRREWHAKWALVAHQGASGMFNDIPVAALSVLVYHCFLNAHAMLSPAFGVVHSQLQSNAMDWDALDGFDSNQVVDFYTSSGLGSHPQGSVVFPPPLEKNASSATAADKGFDIDQLIYDTPPTLEELVSAASGQQNLLNQSQSQNFLAIQDDPSLNLLGMQEPPFQPQNFELFPELAGQNPPHPFQVHNRAEGDHIPVARNPGKQKMPAQPSYLDNVPTPFDLNTITMSILHDPVTPQLRVPNKRVLDEQMVSQPVLYKNFRLAIEWILRRCERQRTSDVLQKWETFEDKIKDTWSASELTLPVYLVLLDVYMLRANPA
ncbi:hypothetical protein LTR09_005771 [Extremus antarcticus]|uniref:Uncharacterized protein n=1 Tax=Extremus antarcticus TaxID=702011 RepID=A0AAJ0DFX9_9PEZI|nr:hypothetical protein LTR09_005771 [Extremus antarcticus]